MSTDSNSKNSPKQELLEKIWNAASVDEFSELISLIDEDGFGAAAWELAYTVFQSMKRFTFDEPSLAQPFITDHLWVWCLKPKEDGPANPTYSSHGMQQLLEDWMYQYKRKEYLPIRSALLDKVNSVWDSHLSKELIWLTTSIGFRTDDIAQKLQQIANDVSHPLNDTAIGALVYHGIEPDRRDWLFDIVLGKLKSKELSRGCILVVQDLVGPHRTELAIELLNLALEQFPDGKHIDVSVAFSVASKVADRTPNDLDLHKQIWSIFRQHYRTISMTPSFADSCDNELVVPDHIGWFLDCELMNGEAPGAYIKLSRMSSLSKENHTLSWDDSATPEFSAALRHYATLDTENTGRAVSTRLRVKEEAWQVALTAGCEEIETWIEEAVMNETNAHAANNVAKIASCIRPQTLSQRMLDAIKAVPSNEEGFEWTRHLGMIELARSCSDPECLDALLNFGLTRDGHVLLSTVDAITDCALTRIREGDLDVVDKILEKTGQASEKRHRNAAISAFCILVIEQAVPATHLNPLWQFAMDQELDNYSRCSALEAIGFSELPLLGEQLEQLVDVAKQDESDVGWRALELLIRRNLLAEDEWYFEKLGIHKNGDTLTYELPETETWWQTFLTGQLFMDSPERYSFCIASMIDQSKTQSLYQLLNSIEFVGRNSPDVVTVALLNRIEKSNGRAWADTELFRVLLAVSEESLMNLAKSDGVKNWLPVARSSLCEAVGEIAANGQEFSGEAMAALGGFTGDASFQVRRTAFRALGKTNSTYVSHLGAALSGSNDIELRKRGAEAVSWLPRAIYSDSEIEALGLGWDREAQVKEIYKGTIQRRRNEELKKMYTDRLLSNCMSDGGVKRTYRYARALEKLGDDETIQSINSFVRDNRLSPNVGHYLNRLNKTIKKNWKKVTDKWPEPWEHEKGFIEDIKGTIVIPGTGALEVQLKMCCRYRKNPSKLNDWNAIAVAQEGTVSLGFDLPDEKVELQIPDRDPAQAYIFGLSWQLNGTQAVFALGAGSNYPEKTST